MVSVIAKVYAQFPPLKQDPLPILKMKSILQVGTLAAFVRAENCDPITNTCNNNSAQCINDKISCLENLQTGGNYCDAGVRDVCKKDNDVLNDICKEVNTAKYTNICKDNSKSGPNITRKVNDICRDNSLIQNIQRDNNEINAVPVKYPYRQYNNVNGCTA